MLVLTGATGFVGRQILRALREESRAVRVIVRDPRRLIATPSSVPLDIVQEPDLFAATPERLRALLSGADTLIHAAWYTEPGQYLTSPRNLDCLTGTLRLAQAFQQAGGRRFVGIGTCSEYDVAARVLSVETPLRPGTLYAAAKAAAYQLLNQLLPAAGLEFVWCRLFYLHGDGEDPRRLVPYLRARLAAGQPAELTGGTQIRDFLDVREAGERIAAIALGERRGAINVCSGIPVTVRQLAERIADDHGRRDLLRFGARPDHPFDPPRRPWPGGRGLTAGIARRGTRHPDRGRSLYEHGCVKCATMASTLHPDPGSSPVECP